MTDTVREATEYLKARSEYKKIMIALKEKYRKNGKLTGKIELKDLKKDEKFLLASIDSGYLESDSCSLNIKKFISFFSTGIFEGVDFLEVLNNYFGEEIKTKSQCVQEESLLKEEYFRKLIGELNREETRLWLESALQFKDFGFYTLVKAYKNNQEQLKLIIKNIDRGLGYLLPKSEEYVPLAKFSSIITKDSHYFDIDSLPGKLFIAALSYLYSRRAYKAEEINELLIQIGIVRDEISNNTITLGLMVFDDRCEIEGYQWFRREKQPLIINIFNLNSIEKISGIKNKVFVFENPTVFYELLKMTEDCPVSLICSSGQPNSSTLIILDKLIESGTSIYYSGDFDPEGLQIADNLKFRYGDKLEFLGMNEFNYLKVKGENSFHERMGKLNTVTSKELKPLINEMIKYGTSGYQELLIDYYLEKIKEIVLI